MTAVGKLWDFSLMASVCSVKEVMWSQTQPKLGLLSLGFTSAQ